MSPPIPLREEIRRTLSLAGPVIAAQVGMMAMGITDVLFVGPLGAEALAAVSVANSVFFAILILFNGVVQAVEPLVSQAVGAGRLRDGGAHMWQGVWIGLFAGLPLTALFVDTAWAFRLLGQTEAVSLLADEYLGGRAWAAAPFLLFQGGRSFLNGVGRPVPVMTVTFAADGLNVLADWALIYGNLGMPALGVAGAGWATTVSRLFMLAGMAWVLWQPEFRSYGIRPRLPDLRRMVRMTRLGLPIGGQQFLEVAVFAAVAVLAGWLGAVPQAAHQIALSLASVSFMVPLGLSMAATVRVGNQVGAGDPEEALRAGKVTMGIGAVFMAAAGVVFLVFPGILVAAFSPEPEVARVATQLVRIAAVFQISDALQITGAGCLRGAGDTRTPFFANLLAHWGIGLPLGWALAFPLGLGVHGLWWGLTTSLTLAAVLLAGLFLRGDWRRIGVLEA